MEIEQMPTAGKLRGIADGAGSSVQGIYSASTNHTIELARLTAEYAAVHDKMAGHLRDAERHESDAERDRKSAEVLRKQAEELANKIAVLVGQGGDKP